MLEARYRESAVVAAGQDAVAAESAAGAVTGAVTGAVPGAVLAAESATARMGEEVAVRG